MERPDNKTGVPLAHYRAVYRSSDPELMSARTGIKWSPVDGCFNFTLMGVEMRASWPEMEVSVRSTGEPVKPSVVILVARYLTGGTLRPAGGSFLAYAEMPWGQVYNSNFNGRCIRRLAGTFGSDLEGFERACTRLGGKKLSIGDASFELEFLPGLKLRLILWEGDEEYPASSQILFSDNFPGAFSAEDNAVVGETAISMLNAVRTQIN